MLASSNVSIDDDDFDLSGNPADAAELASLLDDLKPSAPAAAQLPTLEPPAPPLAAAPSAGSLLAASGAMPSASSTGPAGDDPEARAAEAIYGVPGALPWEWLAYAYRVHAMGTRLRERSVLLARELLVSTRALEEAHAGLGRAVFDAADLRGLALPEEAAADVRAALSAVTELSASRSEVQKKAHREEALAAARRESASASLDPVSAEPDRAVAELESARRAAEEARAALVVAEARFAESPTTSAEALRDAGIAIEAARTRATEAANRHRAAELAYAEVRRRALLQMSRVAEAESAVEGARVEERRQIRDLRQRQEAALRRLREAQIGLGELVYDRGLGEGVASAAFASVRRAREARAAQASTVADLRRLSHAYEAEAYRKGKLGWAIVGGAVVCGMIAVAIAG